MINDFVIELPGLQWDKEFLIDDLNRHWKKRQHVAEDGQYTNIIPKLHQKSNIEEELTRIADQLPGLTFKLDLAYQYLCTQANNIMMPHIDTTHPSALNIPLLGDVLGTPVRFHSGGSLKKEDVLYEHAYTCPTIVKTSAWHSVVNRTATDRYVLSVCIFNPWDELVEILSNSTLTQQQ